MYNLPLPQNVKQIDVELQTSVLTWNLKADEDYTYVLEPNNHSDHRFMLLYFLEPGAASISINNNASKWVASLNQCCLITNNKSFVKITYSKGSLLKGARIVFTAEWLKINFHLQVFS